MAREPEEYTGRAEERRPRPPDGRALGDVEPRTGDPLEPDPPEPDPRRRLAGEQGRMIASGEASKGHTVLRTPLRRAVFIGGLLGVILLALIVAVFS